MKHNKISVIKKFWVLVIFFLVCFSFLTIFTLSIFQNESFPKSISSPLPNNNDIYYIQTNLTKIGQGKNYNCYENSWGTKIQYNMNQNSHIIWETPSLWTGHYLNVTITGLKEVLSSTQFERTQQLHPEHSGTIISGDYTSTWSKDGNMYDWRWNNVLFTTPPLNFTLKFQTYIIRSSISNFTIVSFSYWNDTVPFISPVSYYIHNFNTGGNDLLEQTPQSIIDWKNHTISSPSDISKYISGNGEIWIQFYADPTGPLLNAGYYYLDFLSLEINANYKWTRPTDVNLRLDTNIVQGSYGYGDVSFSGPWTDDPRYFHFSANSNIIFNATSTFWVYQNKIGAVNSTYYLNLSSYIPFQHQWKLNFYQDPFPSNNFTSFNFTISTIPIDWTYISASQTLIENPVPGGKSLFANNKSIYYSGANWNISYKSPNYINNIQLRNKSGLLSTNPKLVIWDTLNISSFFLRSVKNGRVNLTVSFENKINKSDDQSGISGIIRSFNWPINSTANKNGTYLITISFFNQTEIGICSCFITVYFPTKVSAISPKLAYTEFMKGGPLNLTAFFENSFYPGNYYKEKGIQNANLRWIISNSTYSESGNLTQRSGGYYNSTLNTASLKVVDGLYNLTITANKVGYENQSSLVCTLRCFQTFHTTKAAIIISPAAKNMKLISGLNYSCWVYPNQSLTLQFNYTDIFKSPFLIDYAFSRCFLYTSMGTLLPSYSAIGIRASPCLYKMNISNVNLHTGHYTLLINFSKYFYMNSSIWVNYTIKQVEATIKVSKLYSSQNITTPYIEWENLTVSFKIEYRTTKYYQFNSWNAPVNWGLVKYYFVPYGLSISNPQNILKTGVIPVNGTGIFEIRNLPLSNVTGSFLPGNYSIYIACNATDCQDRWYSFKLTILPKIGTNLTITNFPGQFTIDQRISIEAILTATKDSQYLNQKVVYFNITVHFHSHNSTNFQIQDAANQYGDAIISFSLTDYVSEYIDDIAYLEIGLYFKGFNAYHPTPSFYPSTSSTITIPISVPFDIMIIVYIVLGVVAGVATAFVVHRKVLVPKKIKQTKNISYLVVSFKDIVSLENLFVILKSTGACLISRTYSPESIAESMENVLCKVIANYAKGDRRHDAFCDLIRFENYKILLDDGDFVRVAVTIGATPSERLIRSLVRFVQYFELQNYSLLKNATGPIEGLQGVDDLLDIQFGASLIAPYTMAQAKKLSGFEETLQLMAANLLSQHDYFYLSQLFTHAKSDTLVDEIMIFKTIQDLLDKKVIVPYDATKKKEELSKSLASLDFNRLKANIIGLKNKALKAMNEKRFEDAVGYYREAASLAASMGDMDAKQQFLIKANECSAKVTLIKEPEEYIPEEMPEQIMEDMNKAIPEEIPQPSPEQISEPIAPYEKTTMPSVPPSKPARPSYLDDVRKKSKVLIETEESSLPEASFAESLLQESDELTPFEKELAKEKQLSLKASDLLAEEEEAPFIPEKTTIPEKIIIPEKTPPIQKPTPAEAKSSTMEDIFEILEQTKTYEEKLPIVKEELPIVKEELPTISLSSKELKEINNLISESVKIMQESKKQIVELENFSQKIVPMKEKIKEQAKETHNSIAEKVKYHTQHLLVPRKDVKEEIEITKTDIPNIIKEIDKVDSEVIKIKKEIFDSQKDCKKLRERLELVNNTTTTAEKYLSTTPSMQMVQEKQQLITLTESYSEAINSLDEIEKQISIINQEIVTLMIEDIEKMMAQEQSLEKILNETHQKLKESSKIQDAFLKENKKFNEDLEDFERVISLSETIFNDSTIQKENLLSNIERFETDFQTKIQVMQQTIDNPSKDLELIFSDIQVLKNGVDQILQSIHISEDRIEKILNDLKKSSEIRSKIEQRKKNIYNVIEKSTKFIFPVFIQKERSFFTDFDEKLQDFVKKEDELAQNLEIEKRYLSQTLEPKVQNFITILKETEKKASAALQTVKLTEPTKFLPESEEFMRFESEEKESTLFPELEEEEKQREKEKKKTPFTEEEETLTDKTLGVRQHCPYCKHVIPENLMNLLRKGFEPECPNCGETIKPSEIHLD